MTFTSFFFKTSSRSLFFRASFFWKSLSFTRNVCDLCTIIQLPNSVEQFGGNAETDQVLGIILTLLWILDIKPVTQNPKVAISCGILSKNCSWRVLSLFSMIWWTLRKAIMNITTDVTSSYHLTTIMKYYRVAIGKISFVLMTHFGNLIA